MKQLTVEEIVKVLEGLANRQIQAINKAVDKKGLMNTDWPDIDAEGGALDFVVMAKAIYEAQQLKMSPKTEVPQK